MDSPKTEAERQEQFDLAQIRQVKSRLNAKPIAGLLRRLVADRGYAAEQAHLITQEQWRDATGPELAMKTRPGNISRGMLYVEVTDSIALQELHFQKRAILKSLQAALPESKIADLKFRIVTTF